MTRAALPQIPHPVLQVAVQGKDGFGLLVERDRLDSRKQAVVDPFEQRKAGLRLHDLECVADRRLRHREVPRGGDGSMMADQRSQNLKLTQRQVSLL